jgi:hypothetical protein
MPDLRACRTGVVHAGRACRTGACRTGCSFWRALIPSILIMRFETPGISQRKPLMARVFSRQNGISHLVTFSMGFGWLAGADRVPDKLHRQTGSAL